MSSEKRPYRMQKRASRLEETRSRIIAATAELHQEVGPARTTVAEVARRAGVQRLTVYNHFPDEGALFGACQGHWLSKHPPPDPSAALGEADPGQRVRRVLEAFYPWYRETESMAANVRRDRHALPALDALLRETLDPRMAQLAEALAAGFDSGGRPRRAAAALALDFWTWRTLAGEGLTDSEAASLLTGFVESAAL